MAQLILQNLKTADAKTAQRMQKIYGENADAQKLAEAFKKIVEHIEHKFFVRREKIFIGADGAEMPEVFTGADRESQKTENTNSDTESTHNNSTVQDKQDSNKFNIPNDQYDKIKNEIKDSNSKDPVAYIGEINKERESQFDFRKANESDEKDVGISHFPYRDINDREIPPGVWIANDYVFGNLKPNSNEDFYQHTEFQYGDNNEHKTESADMYFQLPTNGDGMAFADRFAVFEANSDTLKKYPNLKIKSTIYHLPDGLPDGVKIDSADNYNGPHADNGLSDYANRHARKFFKGGRTISKIKGGKKICETIYNIKDETEIGNQ